jgi:hypothetical protein
MSGSWIKAPRHLVMDTIPLMLLLVGTYDRSYLPKFKRLKSYGYKEEDYEVLRKFLLSTKSITVTPGVLAEAANFLENDSILTRDRKLWAACKKSGVDAFHLDQVLAAGDLISQRG